MHANGSSARLTIGEFAAATQLSPKALRLYEEQSILRPAMVDAGNGYRYYRREQVASGRLVRVLREMELPLAQIAQVIAAEQGHARLLLREYSLDGERRFDLTVRYRDYFRNPLQRLIGFVRTAAFAARAGELTGYDVADAGAVRHAP